MDERRIVEILDTYFSSIYNYVYFHMLNQTAAEALVSRVFYERIDNDPQYSEENERLILYRLAHKELYRQKNKEEILGEEHFQDELLPAILLLSELTWEERGLIYLLYQDMTITERAEIQDITVTELLRREANLRERFAMIHLHHDKGCKRME